MRLLTRCGLSWLFGRYSWLSAVSDADSVKRGWKGRPQAPWGGDLDVIAEFLGLGGGWGSRSAMPLGPTLQWGGVGTAGGVEGGAVGGGSSVKRMGQMQGRPREGGPTETGMTKVGWKANGRLKYFTWGGGGRPGRT
ncbi:unnamed protein product [Prunus armeniaca]|uniref:Uncharacterized protein n=1 Tax=Prunus armeniaca TaxID=36596 RepID=A0A6J5XZR1_PRUAR|nr:unnamed protein product [Prunus armeniaca]